MSSSAVTMEFFDSTGVEERVFFALGYSDRVRAALRLSGFGAQFVRLAVSLTWSNLMLERLIKSLNRGLKQTDFDIPDPHAKELLDRLKQLHRRLASNLDLAKSRGLTDLFPFRWSFASLDTVADELANNIETWDLSLNSDLREVVLEQRGALRVTGKASDWRSAFAQLRD